MRIIVVAGARPNFIKVAPVMRAFERSNIQAQLVHTGQHYDELMSDVFFTDLDIPEPAWSLGVGSGTHAVQTASAMVKLEELFAAECPDVVMVVGDVNSTLAGALAAAKLCIPVVHLEAGLRSGDMSMPEELNRVVTDRLSAMLLTPVVGADENLLREGVARERIHFVGNVMVESLCDNRDRSARLTPEAGLGLVEGWYIIATIHRPENTDDPSKLRAIMEAFEAAARPVVFPVHPRTRRLLYEAGLTPKGGNVHLIDPVGYLDMLALQERAAVVVTDSGGLQEEAFSLGTPCVTVRRNTERQITVEMGANRLVNADTQEILSAIDDALVVREPWGRIERWDDKVSERVVAALESGIIPLPGC